MIGRGRDTGAQVIEPTEAAEAEWVRTVQDSASDTAAFQAECTPGYYNGEGTRAIAGSSFSPGPVVFHRLLREWRAGDMGDVMADAQAGVSR